MTEYYAKIIFLNAATLNTNLILLNSTSKRFPNGLGNDNGLLGKYVAFHNYRGKLSASIDGPMDEYHYGRRPTQPMMPNFRNVYKQEMPFQRGYMTFFGASRGRAHAEGVGGEFKDAITEPGNWYVSMMMQGETIPKKTNHVRLSTDQKDKWGIPQLLSLIHI